MPTYHVEAKFPYPRVRGRLIWQQVARGLFHQRTDDRRRALKRAAKAYLEDNIQTRVITRGRRIIWTSPPPRPPRCERCGRADVPRYGRQHGRWCDDCLDLPLVPAALILVPDGPGTVEERVAAEVEGWRARTGIR